VCPENRVEDIKKIIDQIKEKGWEEHL